MTERELAWEQLLVNALRAPDPVQVLRSAVPPELEEFAAKIDEDGLRLSALLVARLRFERLLRGSDLAQQWFDKDPADFTENFRRYHQEVPLTAFFPGEEGELFGRWLRPGSQ